MFDVNTVLTTAPECVALFEGDVRVVAVSDSGISALMRLDVCPLRAPFNVTTADLVDGIQKGSIIVLEEYDTGLPGSKDQISEAQQERLKVTSEFMKSIIGNQNLILDPELRAKELERVSKEFKVSVRTIRRIFYRYLWGGQTELSLVDRTSKRGSHEPQSNGTKRRGPKQSKNTKSEAVLPEIKERLEKGARLFYMSGKHSLFESHILTLKKYFLAGKKVTKGGGGKVALTEILLPEEKLATYRQFKYVCELIEISEGKRSIKPGRARQKKPREAQRGRARHGVAGPGYRYEIDATKIQVQLVSRYGRSKLVSEATLYIIIDVWSGAIVGYAISLENASWALAAKALYNCFTDKEDCFKRLGLDYTSSDWPSHHLPSRLACDRGEMVSNKAGVVSEIGVKVEIMPSMRPDRKGKVESTFKSIKHDNSHYYIPGKHAKAPIRRESDGKKTAALTIDELELIIIEIIMDINNEPVPLDSIPAEIIKEGFSAITHIGMFAWGLEHHPGFTRTLPRKEIYANLLLKETGTVTAKGIHFKNQYFVSPVLLEHGYQAKAAAKGAFEIELRYDEHFADQIWFYDEPASDWHPALNDNPEVQRLKTTFYELEEFRIAAQKLRLGAKAENTHRKDEKALVINKMTRAAEDEARQEKVGKTKIQQKENVRKNKSIEIEAGRLKQSQAALASFSSGIVVARNQAKAEPNDKKNTGNIKSESIASRSKTLWKGAH